MKLTKGIFFKNFKKNKSSFNFRDILFSELNKKSEVFKSLSKSYKNNFNQKKIYKYKNYLNYRVIGMGGSSLGTHAIYDFLGHKIKKKFEFINNLQSKKIKTKKKRVLNLVVSKSGNTIETIINTKIYSQNKENNIFITENNNNYLNNLAKKLKSEIIHHNNFIGGRYSVLSEVGMLPAELMGLESQKFKQLNNLIKNKKYLNALVGNVNNIIFFLKKKKYNSIIINYDEKSSNLFSWYQQLVAESLGKKYTGILPIISNMPKDNHSVMQLYLDGFRNNFFTFFYVKEKKSLKIKSSQIYQGMEQLRNKSVDDIIFAQKKATENVFFKKKIPYRSFEILSRDEKTLGELFTFFILETILLGRALKINPFDQPAVELIKTETKKILI